MSLRHLASIFVCGVLVAVAPPSGAAGGVRDAPAEPAVPGAEAPTPAPQKQGISGSVEAGKAWRNLYEIPVDGYDVRAALGPGDVLRRPVLPAAFASVLLAQTKAGLGVHHVIVGGQLEARARFFHVGGSAGVGYFWVNRTGGGVMGSPDGLLELCFGPHVPLGEHLALAVEGRFSAEFVPGADNVVAFGPGLALRALFY